MPKLSVIMGVYNCKNRELMCNSVDSIIDQTFTDWELLICNDGSTDDTLQYLLDIIKNKDGRIKILSYNNNHGLAYALNYCLKHSSGVYIARQDDDDVSRPERFEKEIYFLDIHKEYAFVGTAADVFDNNGIWGSYGVPEYPEKKSFYWNSPFIHPSIMVRREAYSASGGYRVAKETRRCEDYDLFMRLYAEGYKGYNLQEKLYLYRMENDTKNKHRKMKYRIDEAIVRYKGFKKMGTLTGGVPYIIKPVIVGLIPAFLLTKINKKKHCN